MFRAVILSKQINPARGIGDTSPNDCGFFHKTMRRLCAQRRSLPKWIGAATLAVMWAMETQASSDQARQLADAQSAVASSNLDFNGVASHVGFEVASRGREDNPMQVSQAAVGDAGQPRERESQWAGSLLFELENARRDIELLQRLEQEHEQAEQLEQTLAAVRREVETQTVLAKTANEEASRLQQVAREASEGLQQERERAARLEQDLAAARREVETQTALVAKANEEASQPRGASEPSGAEQQERAARLEQDLAAARREMETQTVLAAKANEEVSQLKGAIERSSAEQQKLLQQERARAARLEQGLAAVRRGKATKEVVRSKQAAEADAAELRQSIQKERKKVEALGQELSIARSAIYAYEAQAAELRKAAANSSPLLRKSVQDERGRAARLEQELATARRDLDMQVALAVKASDEAARMVQAAERDAASLRTSLDQERSRAEQLERALALAKQHAPSATSVGLATQDGATENGKAIADRSPAAGGQNDAQPQSNNAAVAALLARASALLGQGDIGAARIVLERAIEMGSVQASFSLAETYDPLILAKWGTLGTRGDVVRAQDLYAKAGAAGIKEAKARIEALRR